jgi:hypothetical protein
MENKETEVEVSPDTEELEAALAQEELAEITEDTEGEAESDDAGGDSPKAKASDSESDDDGKEPDEALEELEAAELEIEDDPATLLIDEAAEIREMRREELGLTGGQEMQSGEFVCSVCFLMKAGTQLANKSRKVCADCV